MMRGGCAPFVTHSLSQPVSQTSLLNWNCCFSPHHHQTLLSTAGACHFRAVTPSLSTATAITTTSSSFSTATFSCNSVFSVHSTHPSFLAGTLLLLLWISLSTAASMTASLLSSEAAAVVGGVGLGLGQSPQSQQHPQHPPQHQPQHLMGPVFLDEPPARTHFSNSTGAVITCLATSSLPPVKVWWVLANDAQTAVFDVPGLRLVRPNGQLVFPPFPVGQYRQDVHSTVSHSTG